MIINCPYIKRSTFIFEQDGFVPEDKAFRLIPFQNIWGREVDRLTGAWEPWHFYYFEDMDRAISLYFAGQPPVQEALAWTKGTTSGRAACVSMRQVNTIDRNENGIAFRFNEEESALFKLFWYPAKD